MKKFLCLLAATFAFGPQAHANVWAFGFSGDGISGGGTITAIPNVSPADPNPACGTAGNDACRTDPAGAYSITGITGTFSDTNIGILNAAITGLIPISPTNERDPLVGEPFDPLVPASLSFIDYTNETNPDTALSYNNLFFPTGSPMDCDFPFTGTFLDVFGTAFTIAGGDSVVLWGDGNLDGGPLTYGAGVTDGVNELDYAFAGISAEIPEPGSIWLLGSFLLAACAWTKRSNLARALAAARR
jgi:hypothetical protein